MPMTIGIPRTRVETILNMIIVILARGQLETDAILATPNIPCRRYLLRTLVGRNPAVHTHAVLEA